MNIALVGQMCAGKDSVAEVLPSHQRLAMGDAIRSLGKNLRINGITAAYVQAIDLLGDDKAYPELLSKLSSIRGITEEGTKQRKCLQELGTYLRTLDNDIWIREVRRQLHKGCYVITDVRREYEAKVFHELGFKLVYVHSSAESRVERCITRDGAYDPASEHHPAELEIVGLKDACDYHLKNDGSLEELKENVKFMMDYLEWAEYN